MSETVENTIENLRRLRWLTQEELAQAVGVTRQTIIALEKGNYIPSVLLALKMARFFCVPVEEIFTIK
ncbi:MAG: helix-turn-helix transcriptional regulator [Candidatus Moranbacteria bacterium]|nr:helix-turn-helix transcriptional regulator [Candidatus Moranbacteria bacterium]